MERDLIAGQTLPEDIHMENQESFLLKFQKFLKDGLDNFEIVTDYDLTFTRYRTNGVRGCSTYQLLQTAVLTSEESNYIHSLYDYYHPIEIDPTIPEEIKQKYMHEWWEKSNAALLQEGFYQSSLETFINNSPLYFRHGIRELLESVHKKEIPLTIVSGGIGNLIETSLSKIIESPHIKIISNFIEFDESGRSSHFRLPEIRTDKTKVLAGTQTRKNIIMLGDLPTVIEK